MRRPNDIFSGYHTAGGVTATGTAVTIPIDAEHVPSSETYTLSNGEITISEEDRYEVTFAASCTVQTNARTQAQAWLEVNGTEVEGTRVDLYCRQANHGATGSSQVYCDMIVGDVARIRYQRIQGSGTLSSRANGSRITLRRL